MNLRFLLKPPHTFASVARTLISGLESGSIVLESVAARALPSQPPESRSAAVRRDEVVEGQRKSQPPLRQVSVTSRSSLAADSGSYGVSSGPSTTETHNQGVVAVEVRIGRESLLSRIGNWFRGYEVGSIERNAPEYIVDVHAGTPTDSMSGKQRPTVEASEIKPRSEFLRPWAKRDAAIDKLQGGINAIGELMTGIRDHLEKQSQRQDELLGYLSHLPAALEQLPESNRVQAETLKAIHEHLRGQTSQQNRLGDILDRICNADVQNMKSLDALQSNVDQLRQHDAVVAQNLGQVGEAMQNLGKNSAASAQVLQQLRNNAEARDGQIERILTQQTNRFTTLLVVATLLLVGALVAVGVLGWLFLRTTGRI